MVISQLFFLCFMLSIITTAVIEKTVFFLHRIEDLEIMLLFDQLCYNSLLMVILKSPVCFFLKKSCQMCLQMLNGNNVANFYCRCLL